MCSICCAASTTVLCASLQLDFEEHAARLLDQCTSKSEAERVLLTTDMRLRDGTIPFIDYIKQYSLTRVAASRWVQTYLLDVWWVGGLHIKLYRDDPQNVQPSCVAAAATAS